MPVLPFAPRPQPNHLRLDTSGDDSGYLEAFKLLPERSNDNEKSLEVTLCRVESGNLVKAMMQVAYNGDTLKAET